jgi:hypothetical protein
LQLTAVYEALDGQPHLRVVCRRNLERNKGKLPRPEECSPSHRHIVTVRFSKEEGRICEVREEKTGLRYCRGVEGVNIRLQALRCYQLCHPSHHPAAIGALQLTVNHVPILSLVVLPSRDETE